MGGMTWQYPTCERGHQVVNIHLILIPRSPHPNLILRFGCVVGCGWRVGDGIVGKLTWDLGEACPEGVWGKAHAPFQFTWGTHLRDITEIVL